MGWTRREKSNIHAPATHTRTPRARAPPPLTAHLARVEEAGGKKSLPRPPLAAAQLHRGGRPRARHPSETVEAHAASFGGERARAKSLHFGLFINSSLQGGRSRCAPAPPSVAASSGVLGAHSPAIAAAARARDESPTRACLVWSLSHVSASHVGMNLKVAIPSVHSASTPDEYGCAYPLAHTSPPRLCALCPLALNTRSW